MSAIGEARLGAASAPFLSGTGILPVGFSDTGWKPVPRGERVFAGRVSESEKVTYYNLADVMVSPSSLEGFGFSVAEAMSCGLPVVVSDQGALPELVVHERSGFVAPAGRVGEFVRSLLTLLANPDLRRRCGEFNRERISRHYRWERCASRVLEVYDDTLLQYKRRAARR